MYFSFKDVYPAQEIYSVMYENIGGSFTIQVLCVFVVIYTYTWTLVIIPIVLSMDNWEVHGNTQL